MDDAVAGSSSRGRKRRGACCWFPCLFCFCWACSSLMSPLFVAAGGGADGGRHVAARSVCPSVQPRTDVSPLLCAAAEASVFPLISPRRVGDGFFPCLSTAWTRENRRRRRLRRRPWLFGVKFPVVSNGRLSGMTKQDIASLKACYRHCLYLAGPFLSIGVRITTENDSSSVARVGTSCVSSPHVCKC